MENRKSKSKRIEADFRLPEAIIQHIQSFLNGNEAAQTTILSRSWYRAWLTRPNLDLDQFLFMNRAEDDFWQFAVKTMERYEKLNLTIDSLKLRIHTQHSLVNELIIKALKNGATSLDFSIHDVKSEFVLSHQVFGFENLTRLSVSGCKIGYDNGMVINCRKLKSLALDRVNAEEGHTIWDIVSSCPLIVNFSLFPKFCNQNLMKQNVVNEFRNLKRLHLRGVTVPPSYFGDELSSNFPCLEDLVLFLCEGCEDIVISSPSLKCVYFKSYNKSRIVFNVPRIRKFTFLGYEIPWVSFEKTTSKWKSCITIMRKNAPSANWFRQLSQLLKKLGSSVITLNLDVWSEYHSVYTGEFRGFKNIPEVERLRIRGEYSSFPEFYYNLFKCCRPIFIAHIWVSRRVKKRDDAMELVSKRKMQQVCLNSCISCRSISEFDLKKVEVKVYDDPGYVRLSRSLDASLTSLDDVADEEEIQFYLKWGR